MNCLADNAADVATVDQIIQMTLMGQNRNKAPFDKTLDSGKLSSSTAPSMNNHGKLFK